MEMREVFVQKLSEAMERDDKIVVIDADLAKSTKTWGLRKTFPERALDVGIAEQNMASIAAGLSAYGFNPFITSFAPFVTRRILDQVAISCLYSKQNVKIVGTDPGICAEINGGTHLGMEDIGSLRSLPDILIYEPVDEVQLMQAMPFIIDYKGSMYIRLFRKVIDKVFDENSYKFDMYKADVLKEGKDITIVSSGIMVQETVKALPLLKEAGIDAEVISAHTVKPIDGDTIAKSAKKTGLVLTCENHQIIGGLHSAVCEVLADKCPTKVAAIGVPDVFGEVGKLPYLKQIYKMRDVDIVEKCKQLLKEKK